MSVFRLWLSARHGVNFLPNWKTDFIRAFKDMVIAMYSQLR